MAYLGHERRRQQVIITTNTEYHMDGRVCVAVRDNRTGQMHRTHQAIGSAMLGQVLFQPDGSWHLNVGAAVGVGQRLFFASQLVTTPVRAVTRLAPGRN